MFSAEAIEREIANVAAPDTQDRAARRQALRRRLVARGRRGRARSRARRSRRRRGHHARHPHFAAGGAPQVAAQAGDRAAGHRPDPAGLSTHRGPQRPAQLHLRRRFPERRQRSARVPRHRRASSTWWRWSTIRCWPRCRSCRPRPRNSPRRSTCASASCASATTSTRCSPAFRAGADAVYVTPLRFNDAQVRELARGLAQRKLPTFSVVGPQRGRSRPADDHRRRRARHRPAGAPRGHHDPAHRAGRGSGAVRRGVSHLAAAGHQHAGGARDRFLAALAVPRRCGAAARGRRRRAAAHAARCHARRARREPGAGREPRTPGQRARRRAHRAQRTAAVAVGVRPRARASTKIAPVR